LHQKAIQAMENKIKDSLVNCYVRGNWPEYKSCREHVNSLAEETLKRKKEWLSSDDIFSIFYDFVYEAISNKKTEDQELEGNLWDILGEADGGRLVKTIKDYLVSIPRDFDVYIPLPKISQDFPANIKLSESLSFEVFANGDEVPGGYSLLLGIFGSQIELNKVYFRQRISGYCGRSLEAFGNKKAVGNFKILLQQGIFRKLFTESPYEKLAAGLEPYSSDHKIPKAHLFSLDRERKSKAISNVELPLDFNRWINSIDLNLVDKPVANAIKDGKIEQLVTGCLKKPLELIECTAEESIRVKSASQWCFDSYVSENQTLAFLQVCIGLEALLGDDPGENKSLTEMLADRCAYLVSNDIKMRKTIKRDFKELYKLRSKLAHGNIIELDSGQEDRLGWGRHLLEYAINKEIEHLNLGKG
jgi:hypothetical protein